MDSETLDTPTSDADSFERWEERRRRALIAHSERNVQEWMSYLPQDCVESMIRMGWDIST